MSSLRFSLDADAISLLAKSVDYRDLVKVYIDIRSKHHKFGYADLARLSGFSARSFPRDIVLGKKNLTLESTNKLIKGMGLTGDLSQLLKSMVELSISEKNDDLKKNQNLNKTINNIRSRLLNDKKKNQSSSAKNEIYQIFQAPIVFAAMGAIGQGVSLEDIRSKTGLTNDILESVLNKFIDLQIIEKNKNKYITRINHLDILGEVDKSFFQKYYIHLLKKAEKRATEKFSSSDELHFSSSYSVNKSDMPKFKEELRSVLLKYVDTCEDSSGDKIINLVCSLMY